MRSASMRRLVRGVLRASRSFCTATHTQNRDVVSLSGLVFHARHGVFAAEKELGQKFVIDVDLNCDTRPAASTDDIEDSVNYAEVYSQVKDVLEGKRFRLVESIAERIAETIFIHQPLVSATTVSVKKPHVSIPGVLNYCGVTIRRNRRDFE